jgi:hypothetical protein
MLVRPSRLIKHRAGQDSLAYYSHARMPPLLFLHLLVGPTRSSSSLIVCSFVGRSLGLSLFANCRRRRTGPGHRRLALRQIRFRSPSSTARASAPEKSADFSSSHSLYSENRRPLSPSSVTAAAANNGV